MDNTKYYVVKKKAVPEVLIKVVETKRLLATRRGMTIQEATEEIGISRSSFYKYKDDIFPFHENEKGRTVTMVIQLDDTPGVMAELLNAVAKVSGEYPDYSPEYSDQRGGNTDTQCGGVADNEESVGDGGRD